MFRTFIVAAFSIAAIVPANAASLGLLCRGNVIVVVAPDVVDAEQCAAAQRYPCQAAFSTRQGYFAVAETADGHGSGVAGGYRQQDGASARAVSSCEALGAGACTVTLSGVDDGATRLNCG